MHCLMVDMENSLCGDCDRAKMCYVLRVINEDIYDPLVRIRLTISVCEGHKPIPTEATEMAKAAKRSA